MCHFFSWKAADALQYLGVKGRKCIQGKRGKPYLGLGGGSLLGVRRGKVCLGLDEGSVSGIERGKCTGDKRGNCI